MECCGTDLVSIIAKNGTVLSEYGGKDLPPITIVSSNTTIEFESDASKDFLGFILEIGMDLNIMHSYPFLQ